jgi:RNA polymerase sigma-70 factor (ECF subfamily)
MQLITRDVVDTAPRETGRFEAPGVGSYDDLVLPHLAAAYRLARCLIGNREDAEDLVQDASLRAFQYFRTFTGGNARAWFLTIVRNACYQWRGRHGARTTAAFDEEQHSTLQAGTDPEALLARSEAVAHLERTLNGLPPAFRELLVLRELEGLSYRELAETAGVPIGTVMSRLSRARQAFHRAMNERAEMFSRSTCKCA